MPTIEVPRPRSSKFRIWLLVTLAVSCFSMLCVNPAQAHHSFANSFDINKPPIRIDGVLTYVNLRNPHSILRVEVMNEDGTSETWQVETQSVVMLRRAGLQKGGLKIGDTIQVTGMGPRKAGQKLMFGAQIKAASGFFDVMETDNGLPVGRVTDAQSERGFAAISGIWQPAVPRTRLGDTPMPLSEAGRRAFDNFDPANAVAKTCEPPNVPSLLYAPYLFDVRVDDDSAYLHFEYYDVKRDLALDGQWVHANKKEFGRSRAYRDGESLIVESVDFPESGNGLAVGWDLNGKTRDIPSGPGKRIVERYFTNESGTELHIEFILEDPHYLSEPFASRVTMYRLSDDLTVQEFVCDEGVAEWSTKNAE